MPKETVFEQKSLTLENSEVHIPTVREKFYVKEKACYKEKMKMGGLNNRERCIHYLRLALVDTANNTIEKVERAMVKEMLLDGIISTQTIKNILKHNIASGFDYKRASTILKAPDIKALRKIAKKTSKDKTGR